VDPKAFAADRNRTRRRATSRPAPLSVHSDPSEDIAASAADIQGPQTVISPYLRASAADQAGSDNISSLGPGHWLAHRSTAAHAIRIAADKQEAPTPAQGVIAAIAVDRSGSPRISPKYSRTHQSAAKQAIATKSDEQQVPTQVQRATRAIAANWTGCCVIGILSPGTDSNIGAQRLMR
jgi:hypothetical protein